MKVGQVSQATIRKVVAMCQLIVLTRGLLLSVVGNTPIPVLWHRYTNSQQAFTNGITFTEAMTLDASGNLLVGTTTASVSNTNGLTVVNPTGATAISIGHLTGTANTAGFAFFNYNGTAIGSITQSGTTAVLYNTTSDYRLKTVIGPVADAGQRIDALQPVEYAWNSNGTRTRGFLAHEFQTVYPNSVSGEKDAEDEDGNPVYQAMQASTSEVIADLVAELQSLRSRVALLEAK